MSGIEVVGLILGALPLIISGLERYAEGARTIRSVWNYSQEFSTLSRRLRVEDSIYRNAIELLLNDCVDNDMLSELLESPGGKAWSEPAVARGLKLKLQRAYPVFLETITGMEKAVTSFTARLQLDEHGKGPFTDPKSFEEAYKRFRFALKKTAYMDLVNEISKDNASLKKLTEQSSALEPVRSTRRRIPKFDKVRLHASSIFSTLQVGLHGSCSAPHRASLCIGPIDDAKDIADETFRVVLYHDIKGGVDNVCTTTKQGSWHTEEAEVRSIDNTFDLAAKLSQVRLEKRAVRFDPQQDAQAVVGASSKVADPVAAEIIDLCQSLHSLKAMQCGVCLGYLVDATTRSRHGLYWPSKPFVDKASMTTITLATVLGKWLTVADSRRLAASLAAGMLRLHDTPWLAKQWGKNEITLFAKGTKLLTQHPFITTGMKTSHTASIVPTDEYFIASALVRNETLFALGILLIELCMEKCFAELMVSEDLNPDGTKHPASDFLAATRLLDQVYDRAGKRYGDAARRCILCEFDLRKTSLDDAQFRRAVYDGVVAVLEEDVRQFLGDLA